MVLTIKYDLFLKLGLYDPFVSKHLHMWFSIFLGLNDDVRNLTSISSSNSKQMCFILFCIRFGYLLSIIFLSYVIKIHFNLFLGQVFRRNHLIWMAELIKNKEIDYYFSKERQISNVMFIQSNLLLKKTWSWLLYFFCGLEKIQRRRTLKKGGN